MQAEPGTPALLIYTSGTTGRPKGVILDHGNVRATAELIVAWFEMTEETRSLLVLPLFHVNGIMVSVVSPLLAGGSTFIAERFDAATFWATVGQARPTFFSAVPTICALLVSRPGEQADTKNLRYVICGAAPMPRELIREFEQRFGVPVVAGYGLPECTVVCTANPVHGVRKAGSVGLALPGVEVGVAGPAGELLPAGQAGEVVVRGPNVMRGYLRRPAESAEVLRGGWLHTGDVGRFDDDGYHPGRPGQGPVLRVLFFIQNGPWYSPRARGSAPALRIARAYGATGSIAFSIPGRPGGLADEKCTPAPLREGRNAMSQTKDIRDAVARELSYDPLDDPLRPARCSGYFAP